MVEARPVCAKARRSWPRAGIAIRLLFLKRVREEAIKATGCAASDLFSKRRDIGHLPESGSNQA